MDFQSPDFIRRPLRTVLCGTLLDAGSDPVVRAALAVARAAGARLHLVHAVPGGPQLTGPESGPGDDAGLELMAWCETRLREQIARLGIREAELSGAEILAGAPDRVLIDAARKAGAGLLVIGAVGSGPRDGGPLGSTADRVLREAACPVLVLRDELLISPETEAAWTVLDRESVPVG